MGGILGFLILAGILALWIIAFIKMNTYGGSKGIQHFFLYLVLCVLVGGLMFVIIVVPILDCHGFLCGIGELAIFMLGCALLLLVMPIIMLTAGVMRLKKLNPDLSKNLNSQDIIDEV